MFQTTISAFAVDFYMLVTLRFAVGVGIGGMGVPFDLLAEFMPPHLRGKALMGIEFFWFVALCRCACVCKECVCARA